jgi:NTE family protein
VRGRELTMQAGIDAAQLKLLEISKAYQKHDYTRGHRIPQFVVQEHQFQ